MKRYSYNLIGSLLFVILSTLGQADNLESLIIGQFAITTDSSIVYLTSTGNWWFMDSLVDKTEFFVITEPLIRYDTLQVIKTQASTPVGVYHHIVSDTARIINHKLSIASVLRIEPSGIKHVEDISFDSVVLTIPKCPREVLLTVPSAYAILMLLINQKGNVTESHILDTSWNSEWNRVSYNSIQDIDFEPIMINGKSEKTWMIIPLGLYVEHLREIIR